MAVQNGYKTSPIKNYVITNNGLGIKDPKKVKVAKGLSVSKSEAVKMRKRPGGSNVGKYKNVSKSDFAGPAGGAPQGSFPIYDKPHAKAALAYARTAPNPAGIKRAVKRKYPSLAKKK